MAGEACTVGAWRFEARCVKFGLGKVRQAGCVLLWCVVLGCGMAGMARCGMFRQGSFWFGSVRQVWTGMLG